jgi:hypothetical protein
VKGIVNLSSHVLTSDELKILSLGHSFVSKPAFLNPNQTKRQLLSVVYNKPTIQEILTDLQKIKCPYNLNNSENKILNNLKNNPNIVITKADKGDSWVVLNKEDYIWECERQLNDASVYKPLAVSQMKVNIKLFRNVLNNMLRKKDISKALFSKLSVKEDELKNRIFYTLPKIHKAPSSWPLKFVIPPGRPIIGNSYSEDTEICRYIDSFLRPIVETQPFILSNSDQLLNTLKDVSLSPNSILFSLDVASLYTNIPIVKGIETVRYFFEKFPDNKRPNQRILTLLSISLFKNDFVFNGKFFRQIKGVAMGKQFAPNFANLYMCRWEDQILNVLPGPKPKIWLRYIDDIFGIWEGSLKDLYSFFNSINQFDSNIQVSGNTSLFDIQFLDLVLFKNADFKIASMVYLKPTSSLKLIHPKSLHPKHTKTGVIVSQILRYLKNCTFEADFLHNLKFLIFALKEQGYSRTVVRLAKQKAFEYSNFSVDVHGVILKGFFPCKNKCATCLNHGTVTSHFEFPGGAKVISQYLTCAAKNAIYIIVCLKCQLKYVGETSRTVKERIGQHLSTIRLKYDTPISEHFNQIGHSIEDFRFFALISNPHWSDEKRKFTENKWIDKLQTLKPKGINTDTNKLYTKYITVPFKGRVSLPNSLHPFIESNIKPSFTTGVPLRVSFNHKHKIARL